MNKGRTPYRVCGPFLLALLLSGCGERTRPSAEESEQLDNAADMLNAAPDVLANIDENALDDSGNNVAGSEPD